MITDDQQASMVKWGGTAAGTLAGAYVGYKIAAKHFEKNKLAGALIGGVALGSIVFALIHYGTTTIVAQVPATQQQTSPAQTTAPANAETARKAGHFVSGPCPGGYYSQGTNSSGQRWCQPMGT